MATLHGDAAILHTLTRFITESKSDTHVTTRALIVEGEDGVGKTHLMEAGLDVARRNGLHVVGPIDGHDMIGCPNCWSRSPHAPDWLGGHQLPADARLPLLVAVDDANHADAERLGREMRWLSRNYGLSSTWLVAARAPNQLSTVAAEQTAYGALDNLSEEVVTRLVTKELGASPTPELLAYVAQAGGNPRLVNELIVGLREESELRIVDGRAHVLDTGIPQRIVRLVGRRLGGLSPRCRRMLQVAAVLDRLLCPTTAAEIMAEPVASMLPLIEEATDAGLVAVDGPTPRFRNTLLWRTIRASAPGYMHVALRQQADRATEESRVERALANLSDKERTIARLAGEGLTNQQIARRVFLSPHTINYYLRHIFRKLEVTSRIELAKLLPDNESAGHEDRPTDVLTLRASRHHPRRDHAS